MYDYISLRLFLWHAGYWDCIAWLKPNSMRDFCQCESIMFLCQPVRWIVSPVLWERAVPVAKPATVFLSLVIVVCFGVHDWSCRYQHYRCESHKLDGNSMALECLRGSKELFLDFLARHFPLLLLKLKNLGSCSLLCKEYQSFIPSIYVMHCLLLFCVTTRLSDYPQCSFS